VNRRVEHWIETEMRRIDPGSYSQANRFVAHADSAAAGR
jgi:1-acyl-sn-glycerol-3-phosphate acyltransferase